MKRILFLTGTRADFGKLKSLIATASTIENIEVNVFVTGMHMLSKYGETYKEIEKQGYKNTFYYINQSNGDDMDVVLQKTLLGLSDYVREKRPDMIVVHGDRVEALAGALVGSLNNIKVAHIEGGEVSGTIDESMRHAITKLSHLHLVANQNAYDRLVQLGENTSSIQIIGSPDLDVMGSSDLPTLEEVKARYDLTYDNYSILMYHPVTTELDSLKSDVEALLEAVVESGRNYIVIYPNNDHGSDIILDEYAKTKDNKRLRFFPSLRFEYFLVLLKNAEMLIGNSSAGVRETPFYGVPSVNVGTRQNGRACSKMIINSSLNKAEILSAIKLALKTEPYKEYEFGDGNSSEKFYELLTKGSIWDSNIQKKFVDIR